MKLSIRAAILSASLIITAPAFADTVYNVSKVVITGSKSVPTDQLMAVVKEHPGSKSTTADLIADRDAIMKVLGAANVVGSIIVKVLPQGSKSEIIFAIDDQGVQAPVVTNVAPKLDAEIFDGNVVLSTDTLAAASGLKPGDDLSNEKIAAAEQAIKAAYDASKQPVSALITNENKPVAGGKYDVIWHITETKVAPPKPKKDTSDSGAVSE